MTLTIRLADNSQRTRHLHLGSTEADIELAVTDVQIESGMPVVDWECS